MLGERWTLLIVRDMIVGATRFNDLSRCLPRLSRTLLGKRLRELERAGLVEHVDGEYLLTDAGRQLEPIVFGLGEWGAKWAFGEPVVDELDPQLLVWWMHERLDTTLLPEGRFVLQVRFSDESRQFWIVCDENGPSVCDADPGFDVDVAVVSDLRSLHEVWLGRTPLATAVRSGRLRFEGPGELCRMMPGVFRLSPVAPMVAAAISG